MGVDAKTAEAIAALARLSLAPAGDEAGGQAGGAENEAEIARVAGEMSKIIGYMDILNEFDTSGVEPMYSPMTDPQPPREDVPREPKEGSGDWILDGAPETFGRFFCVPRIF
ncbi:MAG: Asp-tRNA(Asn)/Glu-tRNA(Gln) amidotransferase subunit GatC [Deltaproteobacteria bacterium]|jgi:aspartyl-tRNA(Asn)/glutamyl-tRNA(Gln) amidotransferase subunit C|nr:Asp-tRNA(Asn)/Glu-tRNA(Gln) amidotransferase subunit GatC [Deltaproteobacteria bacterium]